MPADLTKPFSESCCDGGECSTSHESARPCGCDPSVGWICAEHKKFISPEVDRTECLAPNLAPSTAYGDYKCRCIGCVEWMRAYSRWHKQTEKSKKTRDIRQQELGKELAEKARNYRKTNPENVLATYLKRYGLTLETYRSMGNVCWICGNPPKEGTRLFVDHDHETNKVRGALCHLCNSGLGYFRDSILLLNCASAYLWRHHKDEEDFIQRSIAPTFGNSRK